MSKLTVTRRAIGGTIPAFRLAVLAAGLLVFSPVQAEEPGPYTRTGSRISKDAEAVDPAAARRTLKEVARCVYRRHPDIAERLLQNSDQRTVDYQSIGISEDDIVKELDLPECLGGSKVGFELRTMMSMNSAALRVALAEESYLERHDEPLAIPAGAEEILSTRYFVQSPSIEQARGLGAFADCTVFRASVEADGLLRTSPGTRDESAAARALVPALSECLVEGQEVSLDAKGIREIVADGLWSRSHYSSGTVTGGAE